MNITSHYLYGIVTIMLNHNHLYIKHHWNFSQYDMDQIKILQQDITES